MLLNKIPYVYHLTASNNIPHISKSRLLHSTTTLVNASQLSPDEKNEFVRNRRPDNVIIKVDGASIAIQDQTPISIKNLNKCLQNGTSARDFIKLLNNRVFFWPSIKRLNTHFARYSHEGPRILRVPLEDLIDANEDILLCHLNSGATRCHPKWGGAPPPRDLNTFQTVENYNEGIGRLAEITVIDTCIIPESAMISSNPNGPWVDFE